MHVINQNLHLPSGENWIPNPQRLLHLDDRLTLEVASKLTEKIERLRKLSSKEIVIRIRSGGGQVKAFHKLEKIINPGKPGGKHCRFITIGTHASSAAAYLLVIGHLAYADPQTQLCFHGVRLDRFERQRRSLKREQVLAIGLRMDHENRAIANKMAQKVSFRLAARLCQLRERRLFKPDSNRAAKFFQKFSKAIGDELASASTKNLLQRTVDRFISLHAVSGHFPKGKPARIDRQLARKEARLFTAVIEREVRAHRKIAWTMKPAAAAEIMLDFLLARDFIRGRHSGLIDKLAKHHGEGLLTKSQEIRYRRLQGHTPARARRYLAVAARPVAFGLWCFALALCHGLLSGEFTLSACEAYWLGLIDEVLA